MDIHQFVNKNYKWANEPCLYIVKCEHATAYRCGAAGTRVHRDADPNWNERQPSSLKTRMRMYTGYWLPLKGKIYAALRVRKQLVLKKGDRTGIGPDGKPYAIDTAFHTLVLEKEKEFHRKLDGEKLRWDESKRKNELFKGPVQKLIDVLKTIDGLEFYTMTSTDAIQDKRFVSSVDDDVVETSTRALPSRSGTTRVSLSRADIDRLRANDEETKKKVVDMAKQKKVNKALKKLQFSYGSRVASKSLLPRHPQKY